jgi:low affinity Fe/Cu permease
LSWFDRLSERLGAFFSRGHVFAVWCLGNVLWLAWFPFVSAGLAKSDLSDRLNFWQLPWLTIINIFTLFYAIWISNNQLCEAIGKEREVSTS